MLSAEPVLQVVFWRGPLRRIEHTIAYFAPTRPVISAKRDRDFTLNVTNEMDAV